MNPRALPPLVSLLALLGVCPPTGAEPAPSPDLLQTRITLGLGATYDAAAPGPLSTQERFRMDLTSAVFDLHAGLTINGDRRYGPDIANFKQDKNLFHTYFFLDDGYTVVRPLAPLTLTAGRIPQADLVDSPYSLFVNSGGLNASGAVLRYEDANFLYEDRWIGLNSRSDFGSDSRTPAAWGSGGFNTGGFPDRGANLKALVYKRGTMRFGFQDSVVYAGRTFDASYFFNPIPQYFTQYFPAMGGRPWTTSWTDKYALGGFWDWREADFDLVAQVLVNDFSLHFLMPDQVPDNPWKAAWSVGGRTVTPWGRFGLYHAGSLRYTFEPITAGARNPIQNAVGMTYSPDVEFWGDGGFQELTIEENAIGYLHGEDSLALKATWESAWTGPLGGQTSLEYLTVGANSPANPWQDANASNDIGTHWLDGPLYEHRITWSTRWTWTEGPWSWFAAADLGVRINPLHLEAPNLPPDTTNWAPLDTLIKIYKPQRGLEAIERITLGGSFAFP